MPELEDTFFVKASVEAFNEAKREGDKAVMLKVIQTLRAYGYNEVADNLRNNHI